MHNACTGKSGTGTRFSVYRYPGRVHVPYMYYFRIFNFLLASLICTSSTSKNLCLDIKEPIFPKGERDSFLNDFVFKNKLACESESIASFV